MKLIIDYGNTLVKIALFSGDIITGFKVFENMTVEQVEYFIDENKSRKSDDEIVKYCIVSSARNLPEKISSFLNSRFNTIELNHSTRLPITIKYITPESLGNDRIALAVAASGMFPSEDVLVIDAGTCITYDFINRKNEYLGGAISPGINMRYKALNAFTDKLPLINNIGNAELTGNSTESSIRSGVLNGIITEVDGIIEQYKKIYPSLKTVFTGGDVNYFDKNLKNNIFANSNLVLTGLNMILKYNVEE
jgi:type III pantothenate kinase